MPYATRSRARSAPLDLGDFVGLGAAGGHDFHRRAFFLADQRARQRRGDRDAALLGVGLRFANDLPYGLLVGILVDQRYGGAEFYGVAREFANVDNVGPCQLVFQLGGGTRVPRKGTVFVSVRDTDKTRIVEAVRLLFSLGFKVMATSGTQRFLADSGVPTEKVNKVLEGRPHIVDAIMNGDIQLVFNTTEGPQAMADSRSLRRAALLHKVPYYTTLSGAVAAAQGIRAYLGGDLEVRTLQSYFSET